MLAAELQSSWAACKQVNWNQINQKLKRRVNIFDLWTVNSTVCLEKETKMFFVISSTKLGRI